MLANALPGGYRVAGVFAFTQLLSFEKSAEFSTQYFWLGFAGTITAIPIATICYSKTHKLNGIQVIVLITSSSILSTTIIDFICQSNSKTFFWNILIATILMAFFEVERTKLAVNGKFQRLTLALLFSCSSLILSILAFKEHIKLEITFFVLLLSLPVLAQGAISQQSQLPTIKWKNLMVSFLGFSVSSCLSTGLFFLLPLIIIFEYGDSSAPNIARMFVLSSAFFLLPRTLSARSIPALRNGDFRYNDVKQICVVIFFVSIFIYGLFLFVSLIWFHEFLPLFALAFGLLTTQFALPFSNVLMVGGNYQDILLINIYYAGLFAVLTILTILCLDQGSDRATIICIAFTISNLVKMRLTSNKVHALLKDLK